MCVQPNSVIVSRGEGYSDDIAELYAVSEGLVHESYIANWDNHGKSASYIRNNQLIKLCNLYLIFWDGEDPSTKSLIDLIRKRSVKPIIVARYDDNELITPHSNGVVNIHKTKCDIYCGRGSIFGNPFKITDKLNRQQAILKYTAHIIKTPELITAILDIPPGKTLGCFCAPKLCHCDVIRWILDNARNDLKLLLTSFHEKTNDDKTEVKKHHESTEVDISTRVNFDVPGGLYTKHNLQVATWWSDVVEHRGQKYFEIPDNKIIKENIHMSKQTIDILKENDESSVVSIKYHTNEIKNIPVVYCNVSFTTSPFKDGYWYVNVKDVKT